jgi:hypothetical protein
VYSVANLFKKTRAKRPGAKRMPRKSRAKYTAEERTARRRQLMANRWGGAWAGKIRVLKRQSTMSPEARIAASKRMKTAWRGKWSGKRKARMIDI